MQKLGETITFTAQFLDVTGAGLTGATVTCTVRKPDGTIASSGGSATDVANGIYQYSYVSDMTGVWVANFSTADTDADILDIATSQDIVATTYFQTDIATLIGSGVLSVALQYYQTDTTTPIPNAKAAVYDSGGVLRASSVTESNGQITFALDAGTYELRSSLTGYTFAIESLTVDEDENFTVYGTAVSIPSPDDPELLTLYASIKNPDGTIPATIDAEIQIIALPYYAGSQFYSGQIMTPVYDAETGRATWTLPKGATIQVTCYTIGYRKTQKGLPTDVDSVSLYDLS